MNMKMMNDQFHLLKKIPRCQIKRNIGLLLVQINGTVDL